MKHYINMRISLLLVFLVTNYTGLTSCETFTETDLPKSQLVKAAVFTDSKTATAALADCYAQLRDLSMINGEQTGLSSLLGQYTDEMVSYGTEDTSIKSFYNHNVLSTDKGVALLWQNGYKQIYAANAIIEGIVNTTAIDQETKNILKGEALFLRAYLHSYLIGLFGPVPYITTTDYLVNSHVSRLSENEAYEKVIADLLEAKKLLPETYTVALRVRPNQYAVRALLARMYLYTGQWGLAQTESSSIINNTTLYKWQENLNGIFLKESSGTIWQLHPGLAGLNTKEGRSFVVTTAPPMVQSLSSEFIKGFETGDLRRKNWVGSISNTKETFYYPFKYKLNTATSTSQEYSILLRLEEQYLIRAEASAHLENYKQTNDDLNKIRKRAALPEIVVQSFEQAQKAVLQERKVELFTEQGHRWFDLKRTQQATAFLSPLKPAWKKSNVLFPIPELELLANGNLLPQNNGY